MRIKPGAVVCRDGRLDLCARSTVDEVELSALESVQLFSYHIISSSNIIISSYHIIIIRHGVIIFRSTVDEHIILSPSDFAQVWNCAQKIFETVQNCVRVQKRV